MYNSNHLYELFKKGRYEESITEQNIPLTFFGIAQLQVEMTFPSCTILRKTFIENDLEVSGYHVINAQGNLVAFVVLNTCSSLKEKALFKTALYGIYNRVNGFKAAKAFAMYLNNTFTSNNAEDVFCIEYVSEKVLPTIPDVLLALEVFKETSPCTAEEKVKSTPQEVLPKPFKKVIKTFFIENPEATFAEVPLELLNPAQARVCEAHANNTEIVDLPALRTALAGICDLSSAVYFLDFETTQFVIPQWDNITPYAQVPFQYSCHKLDSGALSQDEFIQLTDDPRLAFAMQLIKDLGSKGAILTFNVAFERKVIKVLAEAFPRIAPQLLEIVERLVDLHPIFKANFYNPSQLGSWSLKAVLPAVLGYNPYDDLDGANNGSDASALYHKASAGDVDMATATKDLSAYCTLDTYALYLLVQYILTGKKPARASNTSIAA